ncbi:MAG: hypothetical protein M1829_002861 [Trizodia sp. TS-e1964]|nr:MAG: hypothetical protein M1829_002861 [Trizodia sp. TS-e1964]
MDSKDDSQNNGRNDSSLDSLQVQNISKLISPSEIPAAPGALPNEHSLNLPNKPAPGRLSTIGRPAGTKMPLKFKPRNIIRRSKEERERADREERERLSAKASGTERSLLHPSTTGNTKARETNWKPGSNRTGENVASGPFGSGSVFSAKKKGATSTIKGAPYRAAGNRLKREPATLLAQASNTIQGPSEKIKREHYELEYGSSDDDDPDEGPRLDITNISLLTDDEDGTQLNSAEWERAGDPSFRPSAGLKPIRIDRTEHKERGLAVNLDPATISATLRRKAQDRNDDDDGLFIPLCAELDTRRKRANRKTKDIEFLRDERKWRGVYDDDNQEDHVKTEPLEEPINILGDIAVANISGAEVSHGEQTDAALGSIFPEEQKNITETKRRKHRRLNLTAGYIIQTDEDEQEWTRYENDVHLLADELGHLSSSTAVPAEAIGDGPDSMLVDLPFETTHKDSIYLFQFPASLPGLKSLHQTANPRVTMIPSSSKANLPTRVHSNVSSKPGSAVRVKAEPGFLKAVPITALNCEVPSGSIGKLKVHASGKVTLSWGGTKLVLTRGTEFEFSQDLAILQTGLGATAGGVDTKHQGENHIWELGPISGKFIATPAWDELLI